MRASFASWSSGRKVESVTARDTSGKPASRVARLSASAREGASTSIVVGLVSGVLARSRKVATDSTLRLRRFIGLASKGSLRRNGSPATTRATVAMITARRWPAIQRSTAASEAVSTVSRSPGGRSTRIRAGRRVRVSA